MNVGQPTIGIDVGGTKCLAVLCHGGLQVARRERPTPKGSTALIETIVSMVSELEADEFVSASKDPLRIGVGLPGLVTRSGTLRAAPNLIDVVELEAGRILVERLGPRVTVENDATCSTVAEWLEGAGAGCDDMLMVTIGTGIGAGIVADGRLVRGSNGFAGEIGHMLVDPLGPPCPCGRSGCWERYASGSGLAFLAREHSRRHGHGDVMRLAGSAEHIRGEHVTELARVGSAEALSILDEFARWLAIGLSNMTNVLDPRCIVLGGGATRMGDLLLDPVRTWLARSLYASDHRPMPEVRIASFGESAGAVGAAMIHRVR